MRICPNPMLRSAYRFETVIQFGAWRISQLLRISPRRKLKLPQPDTYRLYRCGVSRASASELSIVDVIC
ncbi:hypothetical protein BU24DRAFT_195444 [Aaosphaeria arxii CBS 175.79]|uniref:Uncharacterized protein n=1 Tax=Aaosphaeria arxii CBS 175.79 TaxID=1450172 RepID=A0A6A5XTB9_9PLEO|nr:uncharacterized protein BU24DRAFT_195444 [Aaosphaeria arxii CBS 175.79]KAF2016176.1 hypothetical protein BU24DRAFT_195444 [Aaosphaeria arxii CBS 175.79]